MPELDDADGGTTAGSAPSQFAMPVALRSWLQAQRRDYLSGARPRSDDLRRALGLLCRNARARGEHVESLIVQIKALWSSFSEDGDSHPRSHELMDTSIFEGIQEFYSADGDGMAASISPAASLERAD
jgi:hypothetical protein